MNVFITGASSGIGAALAREYAQQGATLGLVARRGEVLETLRSHLAHPERHRCFALDVNDYAALAQAATDFIAHVGTVHVVIASAGVSAGTLTEHASDLAVFKRILDTNVTAMMATFAPFIAHMKTHGEMRRLVGIASVAGIRGLPGAEAYSASKAAAISYCESLRLELCDCGIRVVTIAPGYIDTPMTQKNPYRMPFLMPAERFAELSARTIARGSSYRVIPWQMGVVAKILRALPNFCYDRLFAHAPRKARESQE